MAVDSEIYRRIRQDRAWSDKGSEAELLALTDALRDWRHDGGIAAYELYTLCKSLDWRVLPVAGGWLDQPAWWDNAVRKFSAMERWVTLNDEMLSDADGLRSVEVLDG